MSKCDLLHNLAIKHKVEASVMYFYLFYVNFTHLRNLQIQCTSDNSDKVEDNIHLFPICLHNVLKFHTDTTTLTKQATIY